MTAATPYDIEQARQYDRFEAPSSDETRRAVEFLAAIAAGRPVRELAAGTGRLSIPLAAGGLHVTATDQSPAMLRVLASKPGAQQVETVVEDMSTPGTPDFGLVVLACNSLFAAQSAEHQQNVFVAAASWLAPGGHFVCETNVPVLFSAGPIVRRQVPTGVVIFREIVSYQPVTQQAGLRIVFIDGADACERTVDVRFVWPAECALMARVAGLELIERFEDWGRHPFTESSVNAVAVYRKPN